LLFNNWNISGCVKLRMLDNKTSSFDVVGDIPDGWDWQLFYSCNGNLNIVDVDSAVQSGFSRALIKDEPYIDALILGTSGAASGTYRVWLYE